MQVTFTDPSDGTTYVWPVNPPPDGMPNPYGKQRQIDRTSSTGNVGLVKQQGDDGPFILHWEPLIYSEAHEQALWEWWQRSKLRTIHVTDWNGETFEGQIITLQRQPIGVLGGTIGDMNTRKFYCKYIFEFEVYSFVSGVLAAAGVSP
jgi:hypothetical protein